ncbi:GGDEF domain-containing protein [Metallumcola ferriviriculae]|uniref:GGDEF domain-containing protein n=1 Tax=Metallumcola ferriviriculae TaxID=3039180 RepID=A0AAU0USS5_9FIRM|nr:GGDEF domain-containing protein [Desulfitibacteraceae bacterium MK1]
MNLLFTEKTSLKMGLLGFVFSVIGYLLEEYIALPRLWVWILSAVVLTFAGCLFGRLIEHLHRGAYTDSLSGLRNRRFLYNKLTVEMERVNRNKTCLSMLMIDIDNFKEINDNYGHLKGDKIIRMLAKAMKSNKRATDTVARLGGDEFIIVLPETDFNGARSVVSRLLKSIAQMKSSPKFSVSIGITSTLDKIEVRKFIKQADSDLYKEKARKKDLGTDYSSAI